MIVNDVLFLKSPTNEPGDYEVNKQLRSYSIAGRRSAEKDLFFLSTWVYFHRGCHNLSRLSFYYRFSTPRK